ncbi:MAG: alanine dehydrogenase [Solirubrobacterales bacterium]
MGVPRETKAQEHRVALIPAGVAELTRDGVEVVVETGAGESSGFRDGDYDAAGARIGDTDEAWAADVVVKVKEPTAAEYPRLRGSGILFTYLHLAADLPLTEALVGSGTTAIAYETVEAPDGELPLLTPMSEIAGRLAVQEGARLLESVAGGRGTLLGGVSGVEPGRVVVLGGGIAGMNAAAVAVGLGARVEIFDVSLSRLRELRVIFGDRVELRMSTRLDFGVAAESADLVIGAVLVRGARAPRLIEAETVRRMPEGSVLCDVAIDQGGCAETSRPTTHDAPTYVVDGVIHYCVTNMPGAVPRSSTRALTNATLPYVRKLAGLGLRDAVAHDPALAAGVNVIGGRVTCPGVAAAHDLDLASYDHLLAAAAA